MTAPPLREPLPWVWRAYDARERLTGFGACLTRREALDAVYGASRASVRRRAPVASRGLWVRCGGMVELSA